MSSSSGHDSPYETDCTTPATSCFEETHDNEVVESFRAREYPQLAGKIYLDHGGATLYAKSLVNAYSEDLATHLYGNPHSSSTPSAVVGHRVDAVREKVLRLFKADLKEFDLVFVANATAAIKLTVECLRDYAQATQKRLWYKYHRDAHTSLVGSREFSSRSRCFRNDDEVEQWIVSGGKDGLEPGEVGLFAYPGQSNMTGRRLPLSWPGMIRKKVTRGETYTLLDAAALASTAPLDLSNTNESPDFIALSFYKIFGLPPIGALLVRKSSAHVLTNRRYFGGGTVDMVVAIDDTWHAKKTTSVHDALEDGTLPFLSIFALDHAIDVHNRLYGAEPMTFISRHTAQLSKQLYDNLCSLRHYNGKPVIRVYNESSAVYGDSKTQGATVSFNVLKSDGSLVGYSDVEKAADKEGIYVRSGSLCNPGGVATYLDWTPTDMKAAFVAGHRCSNPTEVIGEKATGVVRASLGGMSTASDVRGLIVFLRSEYVETTPSVARLVMPLRRQQTSIIQIPIPEQPTPQVAEIALTTRLSPVRSASRRESNGFSKSLDQLGLFTFRSSVAQPNFSKRTSLHGSLVGSRLADRSGNDRPDKTTSDRVSDSLSGTPTGNRKKKSLFRNLFRSGRPGSSSLAAD